MFWLYQVNYEWQASEEREVVWKEMMFSPSQEESPQEQKGSTPDVKGGMPSQEEKGEE